MFSDEFLKALGRWQRGWNQDKKKKTEIAAALEVNAEKLPGRYREARHEPVYRKRHLYRLEEQGELRPLLLEGALFEEGPTSWSLDLAFAERFDGIMDETDARSVAGAVFRHVTKPEEVILDIPSLWADPDFVASVEGYRKRNGAESDALFHFRGERDQNEVILRAPLLTDELCKMSGRGDFDAMCQDMNAVTDSQREAVAEMLRAAGEVPERPRFLSEDGTRRVLLRTLAKFQARLAEAVRRARGEGA